MSKIMNRCRSRLRSAWKSVKEQTSLGCIRRNEEGVLFSWLSDQTERNKEAIVTQAKEGNVKNVSEILSKFPDAVNYGRHGPKGSTALHVASGCGHFEIVKLLLDANANIDLQDYDGYSGIHYAVIGNQPHILELLLEAGAHVHAVNNDKQTALHLAVIRNYLECVQVLVKHGCSVNLFDNGGRTPIHHAIWLYSEKSREDSEGAMNVPFVQSENKQIVELLINAPEANLTVLSLKGRSYLHIAALQGNSFAVEILTRCPELLDLKTTSGHTALFLAFQMQNYEVCETLIASGKANLDERDNENCTLLHLAVEAGLFQLIKSLVSTGANCNAVDKSGNTALHIAVLKWAELTEIKKSTLSKKVEADRILDDLKVFDDKDRFFSIACYLIRNGQADVNIRNENGKYPLDLVDDEGLKGLLLNLAEARTDKKRLKQLEDERANWSETFRSLESKIAAMESANRCAVCLDSVRGVFFQCGHGACDACAQSLVTCHICRQSIRQKINCY